MEHIGDIGSAETPVRKRNIKPRVLAMLALAVIVYVASAYIVGFVKVARLHAEIREAEEQLLAMEEKNEALRRQLQYMETDEYIETVARRELGLVKPGETAVVIVKTDADEDPIATERLANQR